MSGMDRLTELLPCPFCGGEADTMTPEADDMRAATVMCMGCYCTGKECETEAQAIAAWNRRASQAAPAHEDDLAVDRFAAVMKAKLAKKRNDGRGGWSGPECSEETLSRMLRDHVGKGDPVDVANFAMMLHQRGERIAQAAPAPSDGLRERAEAAESRCEELEGANILNRAAIRMQRAKREAAERAEAAAWNDAIEAADKAAIDRQGRRAMGDGHGNSCYDIGVSDAAAAIRALRRAAPTEGEA